MNKHPLIFVNAPILSDEAVSDMRSFLYALINAYESQYGDQLRRIQWECYQRKQQQPDLFDDIGENFEDEILF
jgi:hypothetical protein